MLWAKPTVSNRSRILFGRNRYLQHRRSLRGMHRAGHADLSVRSPAGILQRRKLHHSRVRARKSMATCSRRSRSAFLRRNRRANRHRVSSLSGSNDKFCAPRGLNKRCRASHCPNESVQRPPAHGIMNRLMSDLGPLNSVAPEFPLATAPLAPLRAKAEQQGRGVSLRFGPVKTPAPAAQSAQLSQHASWAQNRGQLRTRLLER